MIRNGDELIFPTVIEEVSWENDWSVSPGKLSFKVLNSEDLTIQEGNPVSFRVDGVNVFYGFIFTLDYGLDTVGVVAYDQMRYLKNKDSLTFKNKDAAGVIKQIAAQFNLKTGSLAATGYTLPPRMETDTTLADMIKNALDLTLMSVNKKFIIYDDYGALTLRNIEDMKLDLLLSAQAASDFSIKSSIDQSTYNKIKLVRDNSKTNKRDVFIAQDGKHINDWGVLQYYETLDEKENGPAKAEALLKLYNQRSRTYTASNVLGDLSVRPGTSLVVQLNLGAETLSNYMVVIKVKHTFQGGEHLMDLDLRGGRG